MRSGAGVIESSEDAWRAPLLDEIADNFIVEVLDWRPLDLLADVLLLLRLKGELDEDLL